MTDVYACGITMHRPTGDLYEILGVSENIGLMALEEAYASLYHSFNADEQYAYQALTDLRYRMLYNQTRDTKALFDAGFFTTDSILTASDRTRVKKASLPLDKIRRNIVPNKPMIVLFTTGGFSPVHVGHLDMMEQAKRTAEANGYVVVGGFLVPGHDSYVGQKYNGTAACPAADRVAMCELATKDSNWLAVDSTPAIYLNHEINFTTEADHISSIVNNAFIDELDQVIEVSYVYGSDNAGFGAAMGHFGYQVPRTTISSKAIREGSLEYLPEAVADYYNRMGQKSEELPYLIRSEGMEIFEHWTNKVDPKLLESRLLKFQSTLRFSIKSLLGSAGITLKVHTMDVMNQRSRGHTALAGRDSISLDAFFTGTYQLSTSRVFALGGDQSHPNRRAARPGFEPLNEQAARIAPGDYVLVEDDTVTGQTIRDAKAILPSSVNIVDQVILSDFSDFPGEEYYDVVDLRDFILGSKHGGLCVENIRGNVARVPYIAPFVNLRTRAKIPATELFDLNRIIWQCNVDFFKDTGLTLRDIAFEQREIARLHHLSWDMLLEDVARFYLELFPIKGMV